MGGLTLDAEQHPEDQAGQRNKEDQQKAAQRQGHRALLFRLRFGDAKGPDEALNQKIQQSHDVPNLGAFAIDLIELNNQIIAPASCVRLKNQLYGVTSAVSDREALPNPAREALDEPHLDAEELEREIGDSEPWDEASDEPLDEPSDVTGSG